MRKDWPDRLQIWLQAAEYWKIRNPGLWNVWFRKKIENYFRKVAEGPEHKIKGYFEQKIDEWSKFTDNVENNYTEEQKEKINRMYYPYNLNDKDKLVNSWLYEYEIFELVFILKTFDWENYSLLFYGW